jgi:hypothetical protein
MADDTIKVPKMLSTGSAEERSLEDISVGQPFTPEGIRRKAQSRSAKPDGEVKTSGRNGAGRTRAAPDSRVTRDYGAMISSLALALFIIVAAILSISFFAATQFQGKLSEYQINGVPLTVRRLDGILKKHQELQREIEARRANLSRTEERFNERTFFLTQKQAEVDKAQELSRQKAAETIILAIQLDPNMASRLSIDKPIESLALIRSHLPFASDGDIQARLNGLEKITGPTADGMLETVQVNAEVRGLEARITKEQQALEASAGALATTLGLATSPLPQGSCRIEPP